jgi:hypothetical protein
MSRLGFVIIDIIKENRSITMKTVAILVPIVPQGEPMGEDMMQNIESIQTSILCRVLGCMVLYWTSS